MGIGLGEYAQDPYKARAARLRVTSNFDQTDTRRGGRGPMQRRERGYRPSESYRPLPTYGRVTDPKGVLSVKSPFTV